MQDLRRRTIEAERELRASYSKFREIEGWKKSLRRWLLSAKFCLMKTLLIREFTREFSRHRAEPCLVKDRRRVVGIWTPAPANPEPVNFAERAKVDFKHKLPFTFAALLKEGKKR